jgi:hypothetical protein
MSGINNTCVSAGAQLRYLCQGPGLDRGARGWRKISLGEGDGLGRLRPLDKALLALFVPVWLVCFGLSLRTSVREIWNPPVVVSGADERGGYPTVIGLSSPSEGERSVLRVGDRILRLEEADLRDVGTVGFIVAAAEQSGRASDARGRSGCAPTASTGRGCPPRSSSR